MTDPAQPPVARGLLMGRTLALVGIVLVAINLRTAVGAVSPIIASIEKDLPLNAVLLGVIGAAAPLAFAFSGLVAPVIARRIGLERTLLAAMIVMVIGHVTRAVAPHPVVLVVGTLLALLGAGIGNVVLPPIVKRYFPDRIATVTAIYVTIMSIGATVPAILAVPLADSTGWRASLAVWAVTGVFAALPWVAELALRGRRGRLADQGPADAASRLAADSHPHLAGLGRSKIAWSMALMFGAVSIAAYSTFAWMPSLLVDTAGVDAAQAGSLLAAFAICGFPLALVVPVLAARAKAVVPLIAAGVLLLIAGWVGLLVAPASVPLLWVVLVGVGTLMFPLALTLINTRTRTQGGSVALSGFVQGIGYVIGAAGPLAVGLLHDATGGWQVPLFFLLATLVLTVPALVVLARPQYVEDELQAQPAGR